MQPLRIAQISDLHFVTPNFNPLQFFSKRWLGNLNALLLRRHTFHPERLRALPALLKEARVHHLVITGDLSTTSHPREFARAHTFLADFSEQGISVHALPGNHDHYTRRAYEKKRFYRYFPSSLSEGGVHATRIAPHWWLITLDTALATSLFRSHGCFSTKVELNLEQVLSEIPREDHALLANHFPLFCNESPRKELQRAEHLRLMLARYPQVAFYLSGHTHVHSIADLRASGLPIALDCGSTPHNRGAFHLIEIEAQCFRVKVYRWRERWEVVEERVFNV